MAIDGVEQSHMVRKSRKQEETPANSNSCEHQNQNPWSENSDVEEYENQSPKWFALLSFLLLHVTLKFYPQYEISLSLCALK